MPIIPTYLARCRREAFIWLCLILHVVVAPRNREEPNYSPEVLRELENMQEFDYYDMFAHHGYHAQALRQRERGQLYVTHNQAWFRDMPADAAIVLKGFGHQFGLGGTDALETPTLWDVPEIQQAGGLNALKKLGKPAEVILQAKGRLFGV